VAVFDDNGSLIWDRNVDGWDWSWIRNVLFVEDLDGTGLKAIITGTITYSVQDELYLYALNAANGEYLWDSPVAFNNCKGVAGCVSGQLDTDPAGEIVVEISHDDRQQMRLACVDGADGTADWVISYNWVVNGCWPAMLRQGFARDVYNMPCTGRSALELIDVDGDGDLEIITGKGDHLVCIDGDGSLVWALNMSLSIDDKVFLSLYVISGPAPELYVSPSSGTSGTLITAYGEGFTPRSRVSIYANEELVTMCRTDENGTFTAHFTLQGPPGRYTIRAVDENGLTATATFDLYDYTPLAVSVDVGSVHFRGEVAGFYILVAHHGRPVNATGLNATLYWPNGTKTQLPCAQLDTGFYKTTFSIPADAPTGTYTLLVIARLNTTHVDAWGSAMRSFPLSPTLTGWNAMLVAIENDTAIIKTDVGVIKMNLTEIRAEIEGVQDDLIVIKTDVGTILAKLDALNATLVEVKGHVLEIRTILSELEVRIDDINATVVDILGYCVLINTTLGELRARLEAINATLTDLIIDAEGNIIAEIQTALGQVEARLDELNATLTDLIITSKNELMALIETKAGEILARLEAVNATIISVLSDEMGDYYVLMNTTLGELEVELDTIRDWLTQVNATVVAIRGDLAVLKTNTTTILARLDALSAQIVALRSDVAVVSTRLGQVRTTLEALNATITLIEGNIVEIRTVLGTIMGNITDISGHLATIETSIGEIKAILAEWTGATVGVAGHKVMILTTSELKDLQVEETIITISLNAPEDGRLHIFLPKALLAELGVSLSRVDVVLDRLETRYNTVGLGSYYMLIVRYGPGDHTVKVYLKGAPVYEKTEGLTVMGCGAIAAVGVAIWLIRRRQMKTAYEALTKRLLGRSG